MKLQKFEVGKLYREGITKYQEGPRFDFTQSGAILEIYYNRPTEQEIQNIRCGKFELGFVEKDGIIFMIFKFGSGQYMDTPYTIYLSQPFEFMELESGLGFSLSIHLVDASTGILKVIRFVGLSTDFSKRFQKAVERQKSFKFNKEEYYKMIDKIYRNYSTNDLVIRADAWCKIK